MILLHNLLICLYIILYIMQFYLRFPVIKYVWYVTLKLTEGSTIYQQCFMLILRNCNLTLQCIASSILIIPYASHAMEWRVYLLHAELSYLILLFWRYHTIFIMFLRSWHSEYQRCCIHCCCYACIWYMSVELHYSAMQTRTQVTRRV